MRTTTVTLEFEVPLEDLADIDGSCSFTAEVDGEQVDVGIGSYEFWGGCYNDVQLIWQITNVKITEATLYLEDDTEVFWKEGQDPGLLMRVLPAMVDWVYEKEEHVTEMMDEGAYE